MMKNKKKMKLREQMKLKIRQVLFFGIILLFLIILLFWPFLKVVKSCNLIQLPRRGSVVTWLTCLFVEMQNFFSNPRFYPKFPLVWGCLRVYKTEVAVPSATNSLNNFVPEAISIFLQKLDHSQHKNQHFTISIK